MPPPKHPHLTPQYPDTFDECVRHVLEAEGGYIDHPSDPGGETNYGISKRAFPDLDIRNLTREKAVMIYYDHYWKPCRCRDLPRHLRYLVFDAAVNMGVGPAVKMLQRLAGVEQDGKVGPKTIAAARHVTAQAYLAARGRFYRQLVTRRPTSAVFLRGWLKRLAQAAWHLTQNIRTK